MRCNIHHATPSVQDATHALGRCKLHCCMRHATSCVAGTSTRSLRFCTRTTSPTCRRRRRRLCSLQTERCDSATAKADSVDHSLPPCLKPLRRADTVRSKTTVVNAMQCAHRRTPCDRRRTVQMCSREGGGADPSRDGWRREWRDAPRGNPQADPNAQGHIGCRSTS